MSTQEIEHNIAAIKERLDILPFGSMAYHNLLIEWRNLQRKLQNINQTQRHD